MFTIPRMGRRIDAVVIIGPVVFVLEFKVGERTLPAHDVDQVVDSDDDGELGLCRRSPHTTTSLHVSAMAATVRVSRRARGRTTSRGPGRRVRVGMREKQEGQQELAVRPSAGPRFCRWSTNMSGHTAT
jgi:hypothetical protein